MTRPPAIYQTGDQPLTFAQFQALKALTRGEISMTLAAPGTWRQGEGRYSHVVTSTMRVLLERKLAVADPTFAEGSRGAKVTPAGYAALSYAARHKPVKRGR